MSDHTGPELGIEALQMARWEHEPVGTISDAVRGNQYIPWAWGTGCLSPDCST